MAFSVPKFVGRGCNEANQLKKECMLIVSEAGGGAGER